MSEKVEFKSKKQEEKKNSEEEPFNCLVRKDELQEKGEKFMVCVNQNSFLAIHNYIDAEGKNRESYFKFPIDNLKNVISEMENQK